MASLLSSTNLGGDYLGSERFHDYTWIFAVDIIFAFLAAFGIGANDVANAFGTSVGAGALTMRQAVFIAAIFEFTGAFFLGAQVTSTISGGIAKPSAFMREPELLMFGMMCVDIGVAIWLWLATYLELPVSTTHSAVGAVIGMALVLKGKDAVNWHSDIDEFPYINGVSVIILSWFTSPILSAFAAAFIFFLVRQLCLRSPNAFQRSFFVLPFVVFFTTAINMMLLVTKAGKNYGGDKYPTWKIQTIAWCSAAGLALITLACMPLLKRKIYREKAEKAEKVNQAAKFEADREAGGEGEVAKEDKLDREDSRGGSEATSSWFRRFLNSTIDRDVNEEVKEIAVVNDMHERAEMFDPDAEECFKYLQVFTACCDSLAHGANDVANAVRFAWWDHLLQLLRSGRLGLLPRIVKSKIPDAVWDAREYSSSAVILTFCRVMPLVPVCDAPFLHLNLSKKPHNGVVSVLTRWVLGVGAVGIVIGLSTYGYNIMRATIKLSKITPSRGFSIELGAALVVVVASNYGLPVSTTHCQMGAIAGVGSLEGIGGVNWWYFLRMIGGWMVTLIVAGGFTAAFVALGAYSPSAQMTEQIRKYEDGLRLRSTAFQYAFNWEATAALDDPASVIPPTFNATSGTYTTRVVPDHAPDGVSSDKAYNQWNKALWEDAPVWQKDSSWTKAWAQALGYDAPDWEGQNTSTISPLAAFQLFDKVTQFAFSTNQQAELTSILTGEKVLCCDEIYECCPRTCTYKKVDDACESKCELEKEDSECVDEGCDEDDLVKSSINTASKCKLVDTADDCPMVMDIANAKNYIGPNYLSNPITAPPPEGDFKYGKSYTDWREADYNLETMSCVPKV